MENKKYEIGTPVVIKDLQRHNVPGTLYITDTSRNYHVVTVRQEGTNIYYELLASHVTPLKREELL